MEDKVSIPGKEQVTEAAENVKREATSRLSSQKESIASGLSAAAQAMRQSKKELRDQNQPLVAEYASNAADQVDRLANFVRRTEINEMVGEVERFARRQPAYFLGGALLLGVVGARFLKSSVPPQPPAVGNNRGMPGASYRPYGVPGNGMRTGNGIRQGNGNSVPAATPRGAGTGDLYANRPGSGTTGVTGNGAGMGAGTNGGSVIGPRPSGTGIGTTGSTGGYGLGGSQTGGGSSPTGGSQTGGGSGPTGGSQTGGLGNGSGGTQPRTTPGQTSPQTPNQNRPNPANPSAPGRENNPSGGSGGR